uniref:Uncharacterized protein n=1 Tax=Arundo donax TaxID=35708 RepID=A0A0A9DCN4_ARUDO
MPRRPEGVRGSNWSAPKARLQGRMPPAPMARSAKETRRAPRLWCARREGTAAVRVRRSMPRKEAMEAKAMVA